MIIANKWDAVEKDDKTFNEAIEYIKEELFAVTWAEVSLVRREGGRHACVSSHMRAQTPGLTELLMFV